MTKHHTPITNHQITNHKKAPITKFQSPNSLVIGTLGIGYCLVFVIWLLVIAQKADATPREAQRQRLAAISWSRDPFTRSAGAGQASGLSLSGILWDASAPIAIINGQMRHVGEEFDGYRIVEIVQDRVSVTDGTQTFQLTLAP